MKNFLRVIYHIAAFKGVPFNSASHKKNRLPTIDNMIFDAMMDEQKCIRYDAVTMELKISDVVKVRMVSTDASYRSAKGISIHKCKNPEATGYPEFTEVSRFDWDECVLRRSTVYFFKKRLKWLNSEYRREQKNIEKQRNTKREREILESLK